MATHVLVPIADGSEEIEAVTIIDVLRRAKIDVTVVSCSANLQITASRGVKLVADKSIAECKGEAFDAIVLPGGLPGAEHLRDCAVLIDMLKAQRDAGRLYAAICASPAVALTPYGLLDGVTATGFPSTQDKLPTASKDRVVVDGNCITSQGPGTAMEFVVELIRRLLGEEKAAEIAGPLLMK